MKKTSVDINLDNENTGDRWNPKLITVWEFCLFISLLYLLIGTKSSPFYPLNDWVDANAFFTMGKGMMNGKVIYRDLFEQKGPLLYFIYGLASLFSAKTFIGAFIIEVVSFSFFLFYSYKSLLLFMDYKYALISLPVMTAFIINLICFAQGGSAEELCLPLLAISLFQLLNVLKNKASKPVALSTFFWNGIIGGSILWIKYSMLGFWIGWVIAIFLYMVPRKYFGQYVKGVLFFSVGIVFVTLPWVIYFGINNSISDWIKTYFIINLSSYSDGVSFLSRLNVPLSNIAYQIYKNPVFGGILWLGIIVFISFTKFIHSRISRVSLFLCVLFLVMGIYGGELGYIYYYLILTPLFIFGLVVFQDLIKERVSKPLSIKSTAIMISVVILATFMMTLQINENTHDLFLNKEELVQYKFADIINRTGNPSLLNYGSLDMGFYTTTGIIPNVRFFESQNIATSRFSLYVEEQNRYIKEQVVQFVVLRQPVDDYPSKLDIPFLYENYKMIATERQSDENRDYYYYLFKNVN